MSRQGTSTYAHPATELAAKLRDKNIPLRERAAMAAEGEEEHDLRKAQLKLTNAARKAIGLNPDEITWSDTLFLVLSDHPESTGTIHRPSRSVAFEHDGFLFTLAGDRLSLVQFCECGTDYRTLFAYDLPALGRAIKIYEEREFKCPRCPPVQEPEEDE